MKLLISALFTFTLFVLSGVSHSAQSSSLQANELTGWNHVSSYPKEFKNLKEINNYYDLNVKELINNESHYLEFGAVLVRKLANWQRKHSTGIELDLKSRNLTFQQLENLNFTFNINSENSILPKANTAKEYYSSLIDSGVIKPKWLHELLDEPPNITFTLYGENHQLPQLKTSIAIYQYAIKEFDENLKLTLSLHDFHFFEQQNYNEKIVSATQMDKERIYGMIITLDNGNDKTLRNYLNENWPNEDQTLPNELFIELDITFSNFTLTIAE